MKKLSAFLRLSRLQFLYAGFAGVALGAATAHREGIPFSFDPYVLSQTIVTAFHLMVHYANDYFDREGDREAERTAFSGGSGMLVDGTLQPIVALRAAIACAAIGIAACCVAALTGFFTLSIIGFAIGACAWAYSAPPVRFLARGIGELDAVIVVGMLVPLAGYAAISSRVSFSALAATVPGACAMVTMMLCAEIPDAAADRRSGKRNLVVRLGTPRARTIAAIASIATAVFLLGLFLSAAKPSTPFAFASAVIAIITGIAAAAAASSHETSSERTAFAGVALFAVTVTALAVVYGVTAS